MRDEEIKREIQAVLKNLPEESIILYFFLYGVEYARKLIEENPRLSENELQEKVEQELQRIGDL